MRPKVIPNCNSALARGAAKRDIRLGARTPRDFRDARIRFGHSYGHCEVNFEPGTKVYSQVSATIGEPRDSRPGEGVFTVSVWISPAASGEMSGGSQKPALIARAIERVFKENRAVDLESLCIRFGEKAWILRADVHITDMNGCLPEAAVLSVLGSLLTFRRPNAYVDPDTEELVVESMEESTPVKLHLFQLPVLTSFALCEGILLAEPCQDEEEIFPGKLMIGMNDSKELCYLHTTNMISEESLSDAIKLAQLKCVERANEMKELAAKFIGEKETPAYLLNRPANVNAGRTLNLSDVDSCVPSLSQVCREKGLSNANVKGYRVPKWDVSDIKILDELRI